MNLYKKVNMLFKMTRSHHKVTVDTVFPGLETELQGDERVKVKRASNGDRTRPVRVRVYRLFDFDMKMANIAAFFALSPEMNHDCRKS